MDIRLKRLLPDCRGVDPNVLDELYRESMALGLDEKRNSKAEILLPLISEGKGWLVGYVVNMGADPKVAEDVAKETILKYLKMTHAQDYHFLPVESARDYRDRWWTNSWLMKTARRVLIDGRRELKENHEPLDPIKHVPINREPDQHQLAEADQIRRRYLAALQQLPPVQRAAWITLKDELLTPEEEDSLLAGIKMPGRDLSPDAVKAERKLVDLLADLDPLKERRLSVQLREVRDANDEFYQKLTKTPDPPESPDEYKKLIAKRKTARESGEKTAREREAKRKKARRDS